MGTLYFSLVMLVFSLYHVHLFRGINHIFKPGTHAKWIVVALLALFWGGIPLSRAVSKLDWLLAGQLLFRMGSLWLGFLLLFFCIEMILYALEGGIRLWGRRGGGFAWRKNKKAWFFHVALTLTACLYGYQEAGRFTVSRLQMTVPAMPPGAAPITIVQVSDAHYGNFVLYARHEGLLRLIRHEKPDMIVETGDFIDFGAGMRDPWVADWRAIQPPLGKWAVLGNHEYLAGLSNSITLLEQCGFRILRNEMIPFEGFALLGVDDPSVTPTRDLVIDPWRAKPGDSVLLLHHQPLWPAPLTGRFDLGLAGHTHGGQIVPLGVLVTLNYGVLSGLRPTPWGGDYYISRGIGTWGPPIRIASPPEITVITLSPGRERSIRWEHP
ncbi:MAG: metallophosphoesterase [Magnetococcales bacterium]|nr:metallophosphoesterase [Magnetococcales bacterium]